MRTLAIETSCDDTSVGIISFDGSTFTVDHLAAESQVKKHQPYGGVVPELASREHADAILVVLDHIVHQALQKEGELSPQDWITFFATIDFISYTDHPGLPGALLVGKTVAKTLATHFAKPCIPVNHIHGHIFSLLLERNTADIAFPLAVLTASGGHNDIYIIETNPPQHSLIRAGEQTLPNNTDTTTLGSYTITRIGTTLDDAAGECFDKVSRMLGGPYPGGPRISEQATRGTVHEEFPIKGTFLKADAFDFSFSGMKAQVHTFLANLAEKKIDLTPNLVSDMCCTFQEAVVEVLAKKLVRAGIVSRAKTLGITGGVSANERLRTYTLELLEKKSRLRNQIKSDTEESPLPSLDFTPLRPVKKVYSTDNAAMIGVAGILQYTPVV